MVLILGLLLVGNPIFAQGAQSVEGLEVLTIPYISSIFVILGIVCLALEIVTPGFGLGALMSAVFFSLFFFSTVATGIASVITVFVFLIGIFLIGVEILVPGFGLPGIGGIIAVILSIVFAMESIELAATTLGISFLISFGLSYYLIQKGLQSQWMSEVVLGNSNYPGLLEEDSFQLKIGDVGVCISNLRPSGTCQFNEQDYSVLSEKGKYITKGSLVEITRIAGRTIYVKERKNV